MTRLGSKVFSSLLACVVAISAAACGGGSHSALPQAAPSASTSPSYTGQLASVTFTVTIPGPTSSSALRHAKYVSSATKSLKFTLNTSSALSAGQITTWNGDTTKNQFNTGTLPNATCPAVGQNFNCTVTVLLPPGTDNMTISLYDAAGATGNVLSQQINTYTVTVGKLNSFNITFDANLGQMTVSGSGSCQAGPVGAAFGSVGTTPVTFTISYTDPAGKTIPSGVAGQPKIQIQDNTATYQSSSGTINGTGGTVGFNINQASQSFTLTPSNSTTTNASVNVKVVAPNTAGGSDGLTYPVNATSTKSFAFSTGTAPPSHNFLAAVEQTGASSGQVDFFTMTLGPDSFTAFSPATLAVTGSTNQAGQNDVDNPVSLLWDSTGDLIIGNGDTTGGNMACVPVGAIATGANSSTTVTTNIDDPVGLAYEPRNGTVAVGNNPVPAPQNLAEYVLTGNYTPSTNNLKVANDGSGVSSLNAGNVINLPTLAVGTFAIGLSNGCEADTAHQTPACTSSGADNRVSILGPTGSVTNITNGSPNYGIDEPTSITWDGTYQQIAVANQSGWHPTVSFFTVAGVYQKQINTFFALSSNPYIVAASGDGHIAVAQTTATSSDQVQVYLNQPGAAAPTTVGGPIEYNAVSDGPTSCSTYIYGSSAIVTSLTWLSNTKLLVSLQTGSVPSKQGLYIYDITTLTAPANTYDDLSCSAVPAAPTQTAFHQITNKPLATAFKP